MAQAAVRAARSRLGPKLNANGFAVRSDGGTIISSPMTVDPVTNMLIPGGGLLDANLMLMVPLLTGGTLSGEARATRQALSAARWDLQATASDLGFRVRDAYLRVRLADAMATAEEARLDAATEASKIAQTQFDVGKGIEATVRRMQAEAADARRSLAAARNEAAKARIDLSTELGAEIPNDVQLEPMTAPSPAAPDDEDWNLAQMRRGDLVAARARVAEAKARAGAVNANGRPQLFGIAMGDLFSNRDMGRGSGYSVGLTLAVPLFDSGQRAADRQSARAALEKAVAVQRQAELTARREIREAELDLKTGMENVKSAESAILAAEQSASVAELRYRNGKGTAVEQLDAIAALARARANLAQASYDRDSAAAKLDRSTGAVPPELEPKETGK